MTDNMAIFEDHQIRRVYDESANVWYFSVIDIIGALTDQIEYNKAKTYWTTLKNRLKNAQKELVTE